MPDKKILLIHPYDRTTLFLDRIKNNLVSEFDSDVHYFSIKPNDASHTRCLEKIKSHSSNGIIIFLGHGRSDKLYGSKGDFYGNGEAVSPEAINENPEKYYYNDNFINNDNIEIFKDKKVFCLACNSNDKIGEYAKEKGVKVFFGFGFIPTSEGEFRERGESVSGDVVVKMKTELNYIIKKCLVYCISNKMTFESLLDLIDFSTKQRIMSILKNKSFKERYLLADYLYYMKRDMAIYGNKKLGLLD